MAVLGIDHEMCLRWDIWHQSEHIHLEVFVLISVTGDFRSSFKY